MNIELAITGMTLDGDGVARVEGRDVAVAGTIPGERVEARLTRGRDGATFGEVVRIIVSSPHRVVAPCPHFGPCGGCAWQHIAYPEQLRLKQQMLQALIDDALGRAADGRRRAEAPVVVRPTAPTPVDVLPTTPTPDEPVWRGPSGPRNADPADGDRQVARAAQPTRQPDAPWHYRNKVSFVFGPASRGQGLVMGHYRRGSRTIVPVQECPVHAAAGNRFAFALRDSLLRARVPGSAPDGDQGVARHVVARVAEGTGELLATLVVTQNVKPLRRVTGDMQKVLLTGEPGSAQPRAGFHLNVHDRPGSMLFGRETRQLFGLNEVRERVAGISYLVSPTAFFQTNVRAAEVLVREVLDALPGTRFSTVLDLYAGVGLFALPLALGGRRVTAVEENRAAIASATTALRLNRIPADSCRLIASRVEDGMSRLGGVPWDAVILDPPRQGCPPAVLEWIAAALVPPRIVYVSCDPASLARDLAAIPSARYRIGRVQPVDMFPHTAHVETVVVLDRR